MNHVTLSCDTVLCSSVVLYDFEIVESPVVVRVELQGFAEVLLTFVQLSHLNKQSSCEYNAFKK